MVTDRTDPATLLAVADSPHPIHATKRQLLDTVDTMLDTVPFDEVTSESVLKAAGVSRGSMYHFFDDFDDLLEQVTARRYSRWVDESINGLRWVLDTADDAATFASNLHAVSDIIHDHSSPELRAERAAVLVRATASPRLHIRIAAEQHRLTLAMSEVVAGGQARTWINPTLDPYAAGVFVQAYTIGRILNDVDEVTVGKPEWNAIVRQFIDRVVLHTPE